MTKAEKITQVHTQFEEMLGNVRKSLLVKLKQAMASGAVPDEYVESDNYLLAKAIFDSWCRERTFSFEGMNKQTQKEFDNIHTCC